MSDYSMADIGALLGASNTNVVKNSTSRSGNTELTMEDFLTLMVVQLQNQTMDDTMDTSEMMNQMLQMQTITAMANMTEASLMGYASSLVGKVVTIGIVNGDNLEEREILVMGTGVSNGQQVIFGSDGETYALNQIMAVGRLPDENGKYPGLNGSEGDGDGDGTEPPADTDDTNGPTEGGGVTGGDTTTTPPAGDSGETGGATDNPEYDGTQGVPDGT